MQEEGRWEIGGNEYGECWGMSCGLLTAKGSYEGEKGRDDSSLALFFFALINLFEFLTAHLSGISHFV